MFHISYSRIIKFKSHMQSKVLKKKRSKKGRVTRNRFLLVRRKKIWERNRKLCHVLTYNELSLVHNLVYCLKAF